jgi:hypothetical protein
VLGRDGSLQRQRAEQSRIAERGDDRQALGDQRAVPAGPVGVGEEHLGSVGGEPAAGAGLGQQHEREQPGRLGVARPELADLAGEAHGVTGDVVVAQ